MSATSTSSTPHPSRLRRRAINAFIVILLVVFALDTMPPTPPVVRRWLNPLLNTTGLWQGTWSLFAPIPDSRNHRLQADITFRDGTHHVWNSPDWRSQSACQRFTGHRDSEFFEKIWLDENSHVWPAFTQALVRDELARRNIDSEPARVELWVIWGDVLPPGGNTWPLEPRTELDQKRLFFTLIYPEAAP